LLIDADTANEVDDLFAIVGALAEPEWEVVGITSAQFHISPLTGDSSVWESQQINEDIARLMSLPDLPLPLGCPEPLQDTIHPIPSPATDFIIAQAHQMPEGEKLPIVILGSCTNVASAILVDPTIIPKVSVSYLGFWHDTTDNHYDKKEFNSGNDTLAVNVLLNTPGLAMEVMTATTSQRLVFRKKVVDQYLTGKGALAAYLQNRWETYERWWTQEDPEKTAWIMWDVAIIEALIHPEMAERRLYPTPPENYPREIGIYAAIDTAAMEAGFWERFTAWQAAQP
ncbi:MAG: nucleoside hydrolase, partial [Bacteroidota bacterium]